MSRKAPARALPREALPPLSVPGVEPRPVAAAAVAAPPGPSVDAAREPAIVIAAPVEVVQGGAPGAAVRALAGGESREAPRRRREAWIAGGVAASVVLSGGALALVLLQGRGDSTRSITRVNEAVRRAPSTGAGRTPLPAAAAAIVGPGVVEAAAMGAEARGDRPAGAAPRTRPLPSRLAGGRRVTEAMSALGASLGIPGELIAALSGERGEPSGALTRRLRRWFEAGGRLGVRLRLDEDDRSFLAGRFSHHVARSLRARQGVTAAAERRRLVDAVTADTIDDVRRNLGESAAWEAGLEIKRLENDESE